MKTTNWICLSKILYNEWRQFGKKKYVINRKENKKKKKDKQRRKKKKLLNKRKPKKNGRQGPAGGICLHD